MKWALGLFLPVAAVYVVAGFRVMPGLPYHGVLLSLIHI